MSELEWDVVDALGPLTASWDDAVLTAVRPSPFLRTWWLTAISGPTARYVVARRGDRFVAGLAVEATPIAGVRRGRLLGSELGAHDLDLVVAEGVEPAALGDGLTHAVGSIADYLDLAGLPGQSSLAKAAPPGARVGEINRVAFALLSGSYDEYLARRGRHHRSEVRRAERRWLERGASYRTAGDGDVARALDNLERLYEARWGTGNGSERLRAALTEGATRGEVVFHELALAGNVVASLATLELAGRSVHYRTARDLSPGSTATGSVLRAMAIRRACELGAHELDLGPGVLETKRAWSDGERPVMRCEWASGVRGALAMRGVRVIRRARRLRHGRSEG